jgi:hypothetical protein
MCIRQRRCCGRLKDAFHVHGSVRTAPFRVHGWVVFSLGYCFIGGSSLFGRGLALLGVTTTGTMPIAAQSAAIDHVSTVWTRSHAFGHKSRFKATDNAATIGTVVVVHRAVAAAFGSRHGRCQRCILNHSFDQGYFGHNCCAVVQNKRIQIGLLIYRRFHACPHCCLDYR